MSNHARSENLATDLARATHIHICNVYPYICSIVIHGEYLILINLTKTLAAVNCTNQALFRIHHCAKLDWRMDKKYITP